jgi:soluble lytic murein transglycosylase-like protein
LFLPVLVLAVYPATASADYPHIVQPGETLTSVAAADNLSIESIAAANRISPQAELIAGETIMIPPQTSQNQVVATRSTATAGSSTATGEAATSTTSGSSTASSQAAASTSERPHVVRPGETLTSVAAADGVSIAAIAAANHMSARALLIAGQTLMIPVAATSGQSTTGSETAGNEASEEAAEGESGSSAEVNASYTRTQTTASSTATTNSSSGATSAAGPQPTAQRVSGSDIAGVADTNGVPAALAEAIAWQESGWNNAEVSSVGAVGVMQIVPTTWNWIDRYLTPSDPLGTDSAAENIRAGVLLLRELLQLTGGNEQMAVAGYYQGLGSVQKYGMLPSTRRYVADVLALAQHF